ncbi:MAG: hypothetical protein HGA51_00530 [Demequinaceae bacterium]|nr:hypothetical protein [Demequinaceae bacterium]
MTEATPAPCPVHPSTYHDRPQVLPAGSRRIFHPESIVGLPRRCAVLETELMDAEREIDLMDHLWVLEHKGRGARVFTAMVSIVIGVFVGFAARGDSSSDVSTRTMVVSLTVAAISGALIEFGAAQVATVRLRRVLDWRKRVGF